jgi:acetylornithine deacetylase/succinyl-diaminopimelate desuccinylase-like protein
MSQFFDAIESRFLTGAVPTLTSYVTIPCLSPAFDPDWRERGAIDEAITLFAGWASARRIPGIEVSVNRLEGRTPTLVISVPATPGSSGTALLYGHLDKQPPLGQWSEGLDPYTPVRRGDLLFGRGTSDDGYSLFCALGAIEAMADAGLPHGRCVILIEASEESGSPDLDAHLDSLSSTLGEVDLVVCLDSGALDYERLWITSSLRGNVVVIVRVDVLESGVHSGEAGGVVPSSFRILRQLLDRIEDAETGELLLTEFTPPPPAHALAEAANLSNELDDPLSHHFPIVEGLELMGRDGAERLIRQAWSASLSVTGIDGVPSIAEAGNVLRASTTAKLSIRVPPSVDVVAAQDALLSELRAAPPNNALITLAVEQPAQGWVAPQPERWLADALDEGSRAGFAKSPGRLGEGGSIPFLASLGTRFPAAQFIATGVLGPGSNAHGIDESLHLPTVVGVATAMAHVLKAHATHGRSSSTTE